MVFPDSQYNSDNRTRHTHNQYSRSGYIKSDNGPTKKRVSSEASDGFPRTGIQKTVDIELSSRNISTEDILQPPGSLLRGGAKDHDGGLYCIRRHSCSFTASVADAPEAGFPWPAAGRLNDLCL